LCLGGRNMHCYLRVMLKISFAGCPSLSPEILTQFTLEMCVAAPNRKENSLKPLFWGSRSSMLVPLESSSAVLVMITSKSVSICNRFHARRANIGKITISKRAYPSLMPSFEGSLLTQRHQITSLETRDSRLSYAENPQSLSHLALNPYRVVTNRQTEFS